jgi:TctA family transporter
MMQEFSALDGAARFTFGIIELLDGVGLIPVVMGLFGIAEILLNFEKKIDRDVFQTRVKGLLPTLKDWMQAKGAIARGTVIGFFLGIHWFCRTKCARCRMGLAFGRAPPCRYPRR